MTTPGNARGVTVVGDRAFVAAGDRLVILDISNPAAISGVGGYLAEDGALGVTVVGDLPLSDRE